MFLCLLAVLLIGAVGILWYAWNTKNHGPNSTVRALLVAVFALCAVSPALWWLVTFNGDVGHC